MSHYKDVVWKNGSPITANKLLTMRNNDNKIKQFVDSSARGIIQMTEVTESLILTCTGSSHSITYSSLYNLNFTLTEDSRAIAVGISIPMVSAMNNANTAGSTALDRLDWYVFIDNNPLAGTTATLPAMEIAADDGNVYVREGYHCLMLINDGLDKGEHVASINVDQPVSVKWTLWANADSPAIYWVEDIGRFG